MNACGTTEIEAVPLDDRALAALIHCHSRGLGSGSLSDVDISLRHITAGWQLGHSRWRRVCARATGQAQPNSH